MAALTTSTTLTAETKTVYFSHPPSDATNANEKENPKRESSVDATPESPELLHEKWLRLYNDPDVWENAGKRHAMHKARWEYQNAVMACLLALRKEANREI